MGKLSPYFRGKMAIFGFNLDDTKKFELKVNKIREEIESNNNYKNSILNNEKEYISIKDYFKTVVRFLQYTSKVKIESLYRVRKLDNENPYTDRDNLIYPPPNYQHKDRMNNILFRVLYVSLHEFTAMAETQIGKSYIDSYFQLTRFTTDREFTVYKLGQFSELYIDKPRDSEYVKNEMIRYFGSANYDMTIQGYSALECAVADILYDQRDDYHILSSIMADAIFSVNPSIDAIMYPSVQNRYGTNLALKKDIVDNLNISYTAVNQLDEVYSNGFFKYRTIQDCLKADSDKFFFSQTEGVCVFR